MRKDNPKGSFLDRLQSITKTQRKGDVPNNTPIFKKRSNESVINSNKIGCAHNRTSENTENIKSLGSFRHNGIYILHSSEDLIEGLNPEPCEKKQNQVVYRQW